LASKRILKVGIASFEDGQKIVKDYGCRVSGVLDLRTLTDSLHLPTRKSLAAMSLEYLNIEMDKIIEVRCGDWDVDSLSDEQVAYAACDALASIIIYHKVRKLSLVSNYNYIVMKIVLYSYYITVFFAFKYFLADKRKRKAKVFIMAKIRNLFM
jgi:ribonuclease D